MKYLITVLILLAASSQFLSGQTGKTFLFAGSYTNGEPDKGIYIYEFNPKSGKLKETFHGENITNPSFLNVSPDGRHLYSCTETKLPGRGSVTAFRIDSTKGKIELMNKQPSGGENPVYLSVHRNKKFVVNGNYTEGNVTVYTTGNDGSLNPYTQIIQFTDSSVNKVRQDKAHIHAAVFSPDYNYIFFPDLGSDKIRVFRFDTASSTPLIPAENLTVNSVPGSGPRHFTFHPNGKTAYCIEELSGMISVYSYSDGKLDSVQRIFSYSKTQESYGSADIHLSPDGLFLYASNRWVEENTISIFSVNQDNGQLKFVAHQKTFGDHPRNFTIDPSGKFLLVANQVTGNIVVFRRNPETGLLTKIRREVKVPNASCLQMRKYGN